MKILITSTGWSFDSLVDPRLARARWFAVINLESGTLDIVKNARSEHALQGAGVEASSQIANLGVDAVITGHCGPTALGILHEARIPVYYAREGASLGQALESFRRGRLTLAGVPQPLAPAV